MWSCRENASCGTSYCHENSYINIVCFVVVGKILPFFVHAKKPFASNPPQHASNDSNPFVESHLFSLLWGYVLLLGDFLTEEATKFWHDGRIPIISNTIRHPIERMLPDRDVSDFVHCFTLNSNWTSTKTSESAHGHHLSTAHHRPQSLESWGSQKERGDRCGIALWEWVRMPTLWTRCFFRHL